jgi:VWFA-related protein
VVSGLTQDDFTITEDKAPQRIFSFEAPEMHTAKGAKGEDNPDGKTPVTIFVLDLLNSEFQEGAYFRYELHKYLEGLPSELAAPAELIVLGNNNLDLVQAYTRSRKELIFALDHAPTIVPYKRANSDFVMDRAQQSIDALQQIVLQNEGIPGRKNVIWIGAGSPTLIVPDNLKTATTLKNYVHLTANMLVEARISLSVIYPPLKLEKRSDTFNPSIANTGFEAHDPFGAAVNFVDFVRETGGDLFFNRNDIGEEIRQSEVFGSKYYTLTYQPREVLNDGSFRKIRVTLRNPDLHVVTKTGYYAPDSDKEADPRYRAALGLTQAARSTMPINGLEVRIVGVVRHVDSGTADLTLRVNSKGLEWQKRDDGSSAASFYMAVASLSSNRSILASRFAKLTGVLHTQDPTRLASSDCEFTVPVRIPNKTRNVRMIVETEDSGRMGAIDLGRNVIDLAPSKPTPEPPLASRPVT